MPQPAAVLKKEAAAEMLVDGEFTFQAIANKVGVTLSTVWRWNQRPEFLAIVAERRELLRAKLRENGVSVRLDRIRALQDRWIRLRRIIEARAADPTMQKAAGGDTGLLVRKFVSVGRKTVRQYEVDTGLLAEMRAIEKQAAQELGEWEEEKPKPARVDVVVHNAMDKLFADPDARAAAQHLADTHFPVTLRSESPSTPINESCQQSAPQPESSAPAESSSVEPSAAESS